MDNTRKVVVNVDDLGAIHNQLILLHPTGDDIVGVANSIMTLRRLIETSPKHIEPEEKPEEEENATE